MKKSVSQGLSLLLALLMMWSLVPTTAFAVGGKSVTVQASSVDAAAGDEVDVTISLENNPGIASLKLKISYDEMLTLNSIDYNTDMGGQSIQPQTMSSPARIFQRLPTICSIKAASAAPLWCATSPGTTTRMTGPPAAWR